MKRNRKIGSSIEKSREIDNSYTSYIVSTIIFVFWSPAQVFVAILNPTVINIATALFACFVLGFTVKGLSEILDLKKKFYENPADYKRVRVPKPILYHAIFWWLPK